jgi:hypothetical protein
VISSRGGSWTCWFMTHRARRVGGQKCKKQYSHQKREKKKDSCRNGVRKVLGPGGFLFLG